MLKFIFNLLLLVAVIFVFSQIFSSEEIKLESIQQETQVNEICNLDIADILYKNEFKYSLKRNSFWCSSQSIEIPCKGKISIFVDNICGENFVKNPDNSYSLFCFPQVTTDKIDCKTVTYNEVDENCFSSRVVDKLNEDVLAEFEKILLNDFAFCDSIITEVMIKKLSDDKAKIQIIRTSNRD